MLKQTYNKQARASSLFLSSSFLFWEWVGTKT